GAAQVAARFLRSLCLLCGPCLLGLVRLTGLAGLTGLARLLLLLLIAALAVVGSLHVFEGLVHGFERLRKLLTFALFAFAGLSARRAAARCRRIAGGLLPIQLGEAAPQVLGLAPQLLLLPALLRRAQVLLTLLREPLLAFRELLELADHLVEILLHVALRELRLALVLALLQVHLELEHFREIARSLRAIAAGVALLHRNLHFAVGGLRAQQLLQSLLLERHGFRKLERIEMRNRRVHHAGGLFQAFHERADALVLVQR